MNNYKVGFIFHSCFLQKKISLSEDVEISPLNQTGFAGEIHDARKLLTSVPFRFTRKDFENTIKNFSKTGQCVLVQFNSVKSDSFIEAIETKEVEADNVVGSIAVVSANPGIPLCAFAEENNSPGVKFYIPKYRLIKHATNIPGFLDALPDIEKKSQADSKFSLLLKLFRSSLREIDIDNQILFQLILLEEASDNENGYFAERLRSFSEKIGFISDLSTIASECEIELPDGKDVIDLLVKLRNSVAHNGNISDESLREFKGEWVIPVISDKKNLHKLLTEAIRYMFCCIVGHSREKKAIKITDSIELNFD